MKSLFSLRPPALSVRNERNRRRFRARCTIVPVAITCGLDTSMLGLFWLAGAAPSWLPVFYGGFTALACLAFYALLASGFSERFRDPYLTNAQVALASSTVLVFAMLEPGMAFYFLSIMFIIVAFGAIRMSGRAALVIWAAICAGTGVAFYGLAGQLAIPQAHLGQTALVWLGHALLLARCMHVGLYSSSLRAHLRARNSQLAATSAQVERLANVDELTSTLNRRALWRAIEERLAEGGRTKRSLCLAMLDLDHFKSVNDRYGHAVGDEVLKEVAGVVRSALRESDQFGRYGGEEFVVVLPETSLPAAHTVAERICLAVRNSPWERMGRELQLTVSVGVALSRPGDRATTLVARADAALYRAKAAGRDRVVVAEPGEPLPDAGAQPGSATGAATGLNCRTRRPA